jgi:hypothetical protein
MDRNLIKYGPHNAASVTVERTRLAGCIHGEASHVTVVALLQLAAFLAQRAGHSLPAFQAAAEGAWQVTQANVTFRRRATMGAPLPPMPTPARPNMPNERKPDPCPLCGEDRNHSSQPKGGHQC